MNYFHLKPKYYFGNNAISGLERELKIHSFKKVMILSGKSSIFKNGIYDEITNILNSLNVEFINFSGIEPNPRDTTLDKAIDIGRSEKVDLIIAAGGGSVIDASKVIATLITNTNYDKSWDYVKNNSNIEKRPVPIISIITLAGTASENNSGSVITNEALKEKCSVQSIYATPYVAIEDPKYTFTVNKWQTASGIFDCFSHLLEQYFGKQTFDWTKEMIFANIRVLLKNSVKCLEEPTNFLSRANILWTTSMSLNGITSFSSDSDWSVHVIEHAFSGLWDITHGAGLALVTPVYMKIRGQKEEWFKNKVIELGREAFGTKGFDLTIKFIEDFIKCIGLPSKWSDFEEIKKFDDEDALHLLNHTIKFGDVELKDIYKEVINAIKENI